MQNYLPNYTAQHAAGEILASGMRPVPLPPGQKRPELANWQDLRLTTEEIPLYFREGSNIGLILDEIGDVDLDCPEARALADEFLPATGAIFGRPSSPASHRLYRPSSGAFEYSSYRDPEDGSMIVELRTDQGHQTMVPPSIHPSGERLEWEDREEPERVDPHELSQAVSRLAAASLLARRWGSGSRNDLDLAVTGGLLRAGWSPEEVTDFVQGIARAANDEEAGLRGRAADRTDERQADGEPTTGWRQLERLTDRRVVRQFCKWLGIERRGRPAQNVATEVVELARQNCELWHSPEGLTFMSVRVNGHIEHWKLKSARAQQWLTRLYYDRWQAAISANAVRDAVTVLESLAAEGKEYPTYVRVAEHEGAIYLDLCNNEWEAVRITDTGWTVVRSPEVKFRRPQALLPIPRPEAGGTLDELRQFVNVGSDVDWSLLKGFLVMTLSPHGPYPIAALTGEQGTGKTTAARFMKSLIDPNTAPLRSQPKNEHDLMIGAANGWLLAFDNLSYIPAWLSDALCRMSTGGAMAVRQLYTDSDEVQFTAEQPVMLTSIEDVAVRPDLLNRTVIITLEQIPDDERRPEAELISEFETAKPRMLGALLDGVVTAMQRIRSVKPPMLPRMADFARWAPAAEPGLGMKDGEFMEAYEANILEANSLVLENLVAQALIGMMEFSLKEWTGTAGTLLRALPGFLPGGGQDQRELAHNRTWPKNARALSAELRRIAPGLRQVGIEIEWPKKSNGARRVIVSPTQAFVDAHPKKKPKSEKSNTGQVDRAFETLAEAAESNEE